MITIDYRVLLKNPKMDYIILEQPLKENMNVFVDFH